MTKLKKITKQKNSNCDKTPKNYKCDNTQNLRTQKPKMLQSSKTQNVTKHKNSKCYVTKKNGN